MSTAVAPSPAATTAPGSAPSLLVGSLLGAAGVLAGFVAAGYLAAQVPDTAAYADLARVAVYVLVLAAGVALGGFLARSSPAPGVRGGIILAVCIAAVAAFAAAAFYANFKDGYVGTVLAAVTLAGAAFGVFRLLVSNKGAGWCRSLDDQGWASTFQHKRTQGLTVRRWAMVGILIIGGTGAYAVSELDGLKPSRKTGRTTDAKAPPLNYHVPFSEATDPDGYDIKVKTPSGKTLTAKTLELEAGLKSQTLVPVQDAVVVPAPGGTDDTSHVKAFVVLKAVNDKKPAANDPLKLRLVEGARNSDEEKDLSVLLAGKDDVVFVDELKTNRANTAPNRRFYLEQEAGREASADATALFPLIPAAHLALPLLLALLTVWVAWRAVNVPTFGDFLIATEAEMNKVSWTSRKRLIQDTIVVLVCLALLTAFLLVIDLFWGWLLSLDFIHVLPKKAADGTTTPDGGMKLNW